MWAALTSLFSAVAKFFSWYKDQKIREEGIKDAELQQDQKIIKTIKNDKIITDANKKLTLDQLRESNRAGVSNPAAGPANNAD